VPSLRDIRKRIGSVKNTQQITRAMKMMSASRLRRAQEAITRARPYAQTLESTLSAVASLADGGDGTPAHPLLESRPVRRVELVVVTSDRGLAGAFNSNITRRARRYMMDNGELQAVVSTVGRKGRDFFKSRKVTIRQDYTTGGRPELGNAQRIAREVTEQFLSGRADRVYLLYNEFKSAISQNVRMAQLLPIETSGDKPPSGGVDFIYEPGREALLADLLPRHVSTQIWRALLESAASEHGARMTAMESATKNAGELIDRLTLQMNRARQAAITKELMEIVSGSEALK
jgi:F-type H+-transporting ATPase subunit gamma